MATSAMSAMPRPPRLPGIRARNLSWPRRRKSSRSGGLDPPGVCGPEPHGPRGPEPHGPPGWLLHGINNLLGRRRCASPCLGGVIGDRTAPYNAPLYRVGRLYFAFNLASVGHECEGGFVFGGGFMLVAGAFAPNPRINRREKRVAIDVPVYMGDG